MKHMGMRKVLTGAMALMLALSMAGAALAGSYPSPAFRLPGVKERPAATEAPEATETPAETETPEETEAPEETAAPETETPDVTETPEEIPDETEAPEATEAPEDVTAPEPTVDPEVSLAPIEVPEETAAPSVDTGSEVTVLPETPAEPAAPEAPAVPEETAAPEQPAEPEEEPSEEPAEEIGYTYDRDENGALILDESGNPVVHVPEGWDIPVKFLRDEEGNLVLDENGNPVIEQTVPAGSQIIGKEENVLNPNRTITTYLATTGSIYFGDPVTFVTVLDGYEGVTYTLQWQQNDNGAWYDLPGENGNSLTVIATEENYHSTWRVCVNISD